jgi:hypothetical protein
VITYPAQVESTYLAASTVAVDITNHRHRPPPSVTTTMTLIKNEPRDAQQRIHQDPPSFPLDNASNRGVFRDYGEAVKDIMFLSKTLVSSTHKKMQDEMQNVTPDEILRTRLMHARKNKVLCDSKSLASVTSTKSSSSSSVVSLTVDPIPNKLPIGTSSKLKDSGLLSSYRESRKNAKKRKEARLRNIDVSHEELASNWRKRNDFASKRHPASKGMSQQRQQKLPLPQPFPYLNFDLSTFTACVSPNLHAMVSSTSCMPVPDRSVPSTSLVDDPADMDDMEATFTSLLSDPASASLLAAESEPMLAEKQEHAMEETTFRKIAKLKREVGRLQRHRSDTALTVPAAAVTPMTPPAKELASDSSTMTPSAPIPEDTRQDIRKIKMTPPAKVLASDGSMMSPRAPIPEETRRDILKIKQELRELRRLAAKNCDIESKSNTSLDSTLVNVTTTLTPIKRAVRFSNPLVTQVNIRPRTLEEDMEELYFCPEELDELEWDRETTEPDQYECIAQDQSSRSSVTTVAIAHKFKRYEETGYEDVTLATEEDESSASASSEDTDSILDAILNAATE